MLWGLSAASGLLLVVLFADFHLPWLAPVALAPLFYAIGREPRPKQRFLMGWLAGVIQWAGTCHWIDRVLAVHGGLGEWGAAGTFALFCLAKGLHLAVFTWLAGYFQRNWWTAPALALLWTGLERTHAPLGFAWLNLGNAGIDMALPMRLAPLAGVYGLSFAFALVAAVAAGLLLQRPRMEVRWLLLLAPILVLPPLPEIEKGDAEAVVVQPNLAANMAPVAPPYRRMVELSRNTALAGAIPRVILWPEVPAGLYFDLDARFRDEVARLVRAAGAPAIIAAVGHTPKGEPLNSAYLINAVGEKQGRYDKANLVPFGEFVPKIFFWTKPIASEAGDFAPGKGAFPLRDFDRRYGVFICYESAFPHYVREFTRDGAEMLINLTNDGYFFRTAARKQHLTLARMRAAENRRWLLRPTNDGFTAAIDPAGRLTEQLPPFVEYAARLRFRALKETTLYTRTGDWFAWLGLLSGLGAAVWGWWPKYGR